MRRQARVVARYLAHRTIAIRRALRRPDIRRIQAISLVCNSVEYGTIVALGVYAFDEGGAVGVGVATVVRTFPALVAGPLLAVLADRYSRSAVLAAGLGGRSIAILGMAWAVAAEGAFALVLVLAAADAVAASTFYPAYGAIIPELAGTPEELASATAMASAAENGGSLIGPLVAAGLLVTGDPGAVFWVAAVSLIASVVPAQRLRSTRRSLAVRGDGETFGTELRQGFSTAVRDPGTRTVIGAWAFESVAVGLSEVFVVLVAIDLAGWGDPGVGILNAALGAGGLAGSVAMATLARTRPFGRYLAIGILVFGAAIATNGIITVGLGALAAHLAIGHAGAQVDVAAQTLLQRVVPEDQLGRVLGAFEGIYWGARGLGAIVASWAAIAVGLEGALLIAGAATIAIAALLFPGLNRVDAAGHIPHDRLDLIRPIPIFAALPVPTVERLATLLRSESAVAGRVIVREGETDRDLFVIRSGAVVVERGGVSVATLRSGDLFGEIAPLRDSVRTATVRATEDTLLYVLDGDVFCSTVSGHTTSLDHATRLADYRIAELRRFGRRTAR